MSEAQTPGAMVRAYRSAEKISLQRLAEMLAERTGETPSEAKLSRIENNHQPVALDILSPLSEITGIPARDLRPDLAALFTEAAE